MKIFLPWLGEFGTELLRWVPRAKAEIDYKVICYEEGKDCIYPDADERHIIPRIDEYKRKCAGSLNQFEIWDEIKSVYKNRKVTYCVPSSTIGYGQFKPFAPQVPKLDFECDVAIFPRWRHNTERRNWQQWPILVEMLLAEGLNIFVCGHPDSSFDLKCNGSGNYNNPLEASIWAIKHSKIRFGLTTALTVMSLYCEKRPWIIVHESGRLSEKDRAGPNLIYFKYADIGKVGWDIKPLYSQPKRLVEEICQNIEL